VRRAAAQILLCKGYNVMEASDGEGAVRIFTENTDAIELVFLDMTMPGLTGLEALERCSTWSGGFSTCSAAMTSRRARESWPERIIK